MKNSAPHKCDSSTDVFRDASPDTRHGIRFGTFTFPAKPRRPFYRGTDLRCTSISFFIKAYYITRLYKSQHFLRKGTSLTLVFSSIGIIPAVSVFLETDRKSSMKKAGDFSGGEKSAGR